MSTFYALLEQVAAAVRGASLPGDPAVVVRRKARFVDGDAAPLVVISPERESVDDETFESGLTIAYPVRATLFLAANAVLSTDAELMLVGREKIRQEMYRADWTIGDKPVNNASLILNPPFDDAASNANVDASSIVVTYSVEELRNGP